MPHIRRALCLLLLMLLLVQPVYGTTEPEVPQILTAVLEADNVPQHLLTAPFYTMKGDGTWTPILAETLPEDVTADFAGTYGIPSDARRGYAYRITVHSAASLEDGTPITADDCISVIRSQLENEDTAKNWLFLARAEEIRNQTPQQGTDIVSLREAGFSDVSEAEESGYSEFFVDTEGFWGLGQGWRSASDRTMIRDFAMPGGPNEYFVSSAYLFRYYLLGGASGSRSEQNFVGICRTPGKAFTMDDLGLAKTGEQEFVLICAGPTVASTLMLQLEAFTLPGALSYGPYRIVSASSDAVTLEPNPNWWGETDPRGYDRILCKKIGT